MENRGKRGVVLDTGTPAGRAALIELLKGADMFVTNLRPGALAPRRLDYDALKDELPHLIYASVTGYGLVGEEDRHAGVRPHRILDPQRHRRRPPSRRTRSRSPAGRASATTSRRWRRCRACWRRCTSADQTGKGRLVEASLIRAGVYALGWDASIHLRYGEATTAQPRRDRPSAHRPASSAPPMTARSASCRAGLNCFPAVMGAIGRPELPGRCRAISPPIADLEVVRELRAKVDAAFAGSPWPRPASGSADADLISAPMATLDEVAIDPQARAAGCFVVTPDRFGGASAAPASPVRFPGLEASPHPAAPDLGEHTREVLAEAGYSPEAIAALIAAGGAIQAP